MEFISAFSFFPECYKPELFVGINSLEKNLNRSFNLHTFFAERKDAWKFLIFFLFCKLICRNRHEFLEHQRRQIMKSWTAFPCDATTDWWKRQIRQMHCSRCVSHPDLKIGSLTHPLSKKNCKQIWPLFFREMFVENCTLFGSVKGPPRAARTACTALFQHHAPAPGCLADNFPEGGRGVVHSNKNTRMNKLALFSPGVPANSTDFNLRNQIASMVREIPVSGLEDPENKYGSSA